MNIFALLIVGLGASIAPLDFSVNVAFPAITQAFGLDTQAIRLIPLSYVLTYGVLVIGFGALGDRVGHLRVFRLGLIMSVVALTLCAVAPNYPWLIFARVLQGISMALTLSCAPALVTFLYAEHDRTRALSAYGSMTSIASLIAPLAGGLSIALMGWPGVYWFRVPLALLALAALPRIQARLRHRPTTTITQKRASTFWLLIDIFKTSPPFIWINAISAAVQMGSFTIPLLVPYYLSQVAHWGPTESGVVLAIWALGILLGSALAATIARHIGTNRPALIAGWLCVAGLVMTAFWSIDIALPLLFGAVFIHGTGLGLFQVSYSDWVVRTLPIQARGVAGGLTVFTRTIGVVSAALLWLWLLEQVRLEALTAGLSLDGAFLKGFQFICWLSATLIALTLLASGFVNRGVKTTP
ncbi:ProP Permeases of the major facilitator superfamily [Burkholderiaceae bacterium]